MFQLPNPYVLLGGVVLVAALTVSAFFYGSHVGRAEEKAANLTTQQLIVRAAEASQQAAAKEIGKIQIINKTVQGQLETVTHEIVTYRDCHNDPAALQLLNDALDGPRLPEPVGGSLVPKVVPAH